MKYESLVPQLGAPAPDFRLPDPSGRIYTLRDFAQYRGLLVVFMCNHCPSVQHILDGLVAFAAEYLPKGLATVGISSNDVSSHPEDGPELMAKLALERGFSFPYLYDESQEVAIAFRAVCTPDFFMYDGDRRLFYAGRFDGSRPANPFSPGNNLPVTGEYMQAAADALLAGGPPPSGQIASTGCSLKWKPGKEPAWSK
jgi:peroxiredoxin